MAKYIKIKDEQIEEAQKGFLEMVRKLKATNGELSFRIPLGKVDRRAKLRFTETAMWKMLDLVDDFNSEVGWHGIAKRVDDEKDTYEISDILIYPQEVSGATVEQDQAKSEAWYDSLPDEIFNNLRMQGHSHVNMTVVPSGTDRALYKKFLDQLTDEMFYIFLIWNKRSEKTILIYDMRENVLFETADVDVETVEDGSGIAKFLKDKKSQVTRYAAPTSYLGSGYYGGYQTGTSGKTATGAAQGGTTKSFGSSPADKDYATPPKNAAKPVQPAPKASVPQASGAKQTKRMGKPKGQWKKAQIPEKPSYRSIYDYDYPDDDMYGGW